MLRKIDELRKLSREELIARKASDVQELRKIKIELKSGNTTPENINNARRLKLEIARISTVLRELELLENANGKSKNGKKE